MPELKVVQSKPIPSCAKVTLGAMMPKILCVIEGNSAKVYRNRTIIKKFKHYENGVLKVKKLWLKESKAKLKMYKLISKGKALFIRGNATIKQEEQTHIGFDNVI